MVRDARERNVLFVDFLLKSSTDYTPIKSLDYFMGKIECLFQSDKSFFDVWSKDKKKKTYIRDFKNRTDEYIILLCYVNSVINSIPISNLDNNSQRNADLEEREGAPETVHLIIKKVPDTDNPHRYFAVLEEGEKIKKYNLEVYFNALLRKIRNINEADFLCNSPTGEVDASGHPKKIKYKNTFEIQGHLSQDFINMLQKGKLTGLALVEDRLTQNGFANAAYVQEKRKDLLLSSKSNKWNMSAIQSIIREAINFGQNNNYNKLRISFLTEKKVSYTVYMDTDSENMLGNAFIKKEKIKDFTSFLSDADEQINSEIKTKMLELL